MLLVLPTLTAKYLDCLSSSWCLSLVSRTFYHEIPWESPHLTTTDNSIMAQVFVVVAAGSVIAFIIRDLGDASLAGWIIQVSVIPFPTPPNHLPPCLTN